MFFSKKHFLKGLALALFLMPGGLALARQDFRTDSLKVVLLELDVADARNRVGETNIWHRLIPKIGLSANLGIHDVVFAAPNSVFIPRDSYRMTLSLSVNDVIDDSKHTADQLRLQRLQTELSELQVRQEVTRSDARRKVSVLESKLTMARREIALDERIARFDSIRFSQGKIEFDVLARSALQVLKTGETIRTVELEIDSLDRRRP